VTADPASTSTELPCRSGYSGDRARITADIPVIEKLWRYVLEFHWSATPIAGITRSSAPRLDEGDVPRHSVVVVLAVVGVVVLAWVVLLTHVPDGGGATGDRQTSALPGWQRWGLRGSAAAGALGGVVGLILGLLANPPTAPFAVIEVGVPAAIAGGLVAMAGFGIATAGRWLTRS